MHFNNKYGTGKASSITWKEFKRSYIYMKRNYFHGLSATINVDCQKIFSKLAMDLAGDTVT